jgi:hypothetical protein
VRPPSGQPIDLSHLFAAPLPFPVMVPADSLPSDAWSCRVLWIMGLGCRRYQSVGVFEVHGTVFRIMRNCLQDRANLP